MSFRGFPCVTGAAASPFHFVAPWARAEKTPQDGVHQRLQHGGCEARRGQAGDPLRCAATAPFSLFRFPFSSLRHAAPTLTRRDGWETVRVSGLGFNPTRLRRILRALTPLRRPRSGSISRVTFDVLHPTPLMNRSSVRHLDIRVSRRACRRPANPPHQERSRCIRPRVRGCLGCPDAKCERVDGEGGCRGGLSRARARAREEEPARALRRLHAGAVRGREGDAGQPRRSGEVDWTDGRTTPGFLVVVGCVSFPRWLVCVVDPRGV